MFCNCFCAKQFIAVNILTYSKICHDRLSRDIGMFVPLTIPCLSGRIFILFMLLQRHTFQMRHERGFLAFIVQHVCCRIAQKGNGPPDQHINALPTCVIPSSLGTMPFFIALTRGYNTFEGPILTAVLSNLYEYVITGDIRTCYKATAFMQLPATVKTEADMLRLFTHGMLY